MNKQRADWIIRDNELNRYLGTDKKWYKLPSQSLHPNCFIKRYTHGGMMRYLNKHIDEDQTALTIEHANQKYGIDFRIDFV
jgi:hypothetical protein